MHVLYLHGFASSPQSSKVRFFGERLAAAGITLQCPDLNLPDFSTLTASRMVAQTESALAALPPGPASLIGSSLGAFVAWHVAARSRAGLAGPGGARVERLVLLAPAFDFGASRLRDIGDEGLARWRDTGWHTFFHFAYGEPRPVHYALYEDARRFRSDLAEVVLPTLIFQGTRDEAVDPEMVMAFAATRPNIHLRLLDDGHQLLAHLDTLWRETAAFLGIEIPDRR
jgi:pimeloyl-ACP methyl ester carboxylesterase